MKERRQIQTQRDGSMFRIYIGGLAIIALYMSIEVQDSLSYSVASTADGAMLIWMQAVLGGCAIFDAIVNDLLPARWHWRLALRQRHYIMVGMAFCFLTQIFSALLQSRLTGLEAYYIWNASMIMLAAFPDAYQRMKEAKCQTANNS
ncbi:MAG: hypothetical protein M3Y65_15485 [Pseudomonadota bacterium]|nr:hypothetical protein [Pseudomonadota bacterium]